MMIQRIDFTGMPKLEVISEKLIFTAESSGPTKVPRAMAANANRVPFTPCFDNLASYRKLSEQILTSF